MNEHIVLSNLTRGLAVLLGCLSLAVSPMRALGQSLPTETQSGCNNQQPTDSDQQIPPAIAKELDAMKERIAQLEAELRQHQAAEQPITAIHTAQATVSMAPLAPAVTLAPAEGVTLLPASTQPTKKQPAEPFAFADYTWLNGNPRTKEPAFDSNFFTPEIRADVDYIVDFNHPSDDTIGGSSEVFRSSEVHVTQLGVGGDFHYDNVRARLMTQFGLYSQTTPRNDASPARGQWNLADAYRYQRHMADITLTCCMGSTSMREFSCRTLDSSAITTLIIGLISRRMSRRIHRGSSMACGCRFFRPSI
jgi:hypothetical protein